MKKFIFYVVMTIFLTEFKAEAIENFTVIEYSDKAVSTEPQVNNKVQENPVSPDVKSYRELFLRMRAKHPEMTKEEIVSAINPMWYNKKSIENHNLRNWKRKNLNNDADVK